MVKKIANILPTRRAARRSAPAVGSGSSQGRGQPIWRILIAMIPLAALAPGCSVQYVDDGGVRHIWGLAHVAIKPAADSSTEVRAQQVTTFGLAFLRVPETQGLSLGYTRNFSLEVFAETAGELAYSPSDPIGFTYKGLEEIIEENNDEK